jgi:putative tryptophan/tyrosine transport system substrate-binding protein
MTVGRREVITLLGGAAAWPLAARAQQANRVRRIGVFMNKAADDAQGRLEVSAFEAALNERGWKVGGNVRIEYRWGAGDSSRYPALAAELVAQAPEVLMAVGGTAVGALQQATRELPIVFVGTTDPINRGLVASLSRPGGNTTGFILFEFAISGKWLELLKEIAPRVTRAMVIRDPSEFSGVGELAAIQAVAPSLRVELSPLDARDAVAIERALMDAARQSNTGLIVTESGASIRHRDLIITLANRSRLPAVYRDRFFVAAGGLIAYGPDDIEQFRLGAGYVDRILKGEKPGDLPVQVPTRYHLVLNLKTAKALGLTVPDTLLARADEVIE